MISLFVWVSVIPLGFYISGRKTLANSPPAFSIIISLVTGVVVYTAVAFLLLHAGTGNVFRYILYGGCLISLLSMFFIRNDLYELIKSENIWGLSFETVVFIFFTATLLCAGTVYGFGAKDIPGTWGWNIDKLQHLHKFLLPVAEKGLPGDKVNHNWIQVYYLSKNLLFSSHDFDIITALYKISGLPFFFITLYMLALSGKWFFDFSVKYQILLIFCSAFLGALIYPFMEIPDRTSYYLKFYNFTGYYHNTTIWFSNMLAFSGILLFLKALTKKEKLVFPAALLISGSFFFKPSFFTVLAPVTMVFSLFIAKKQFRKDVFSGMLMLLIPVIFWFVYPVISGVRSSGMTVGFESFAFLSTVMNNYNLFPEIVLENELLLFLIVFFLSFPLLFPIILDSLNSVVFWSRKYFTIRIRFNTKRQKVTLFLISLIIPAICQRIFLYEADGSRMFHGNFGWALQSAYLISLPLILFWYRSIKTVSMRSLATVLLFWQLLCGFWKYIMFIEGKL